MYSSLMEYYSNLVELKRIFGRFDSNGDGKLSPTELRLFMWSVGEELVPEDAESIIRSIDVNGDGLMDFDEFIRLVVGRSSGGEKQEEDRALREAFRMYQDDDHEKGGGDEGCIITAASLKRMLSLLGSPRSYEECREMIRRFDADGDGVINFEEFKMMMSL